MSEIRIVQAGASELDPATNAITLNCQGADGEDLTGLNNFGTLGIASMPATRTKAGAAEYISLPDNNISIASRDVRCSDVYGQLSPGDTAMYSTGPKHQARVFCKEESSIVALMTKDPDGKDMGQIVDGGNKKIQTFLANMMFEMSNENGITIGIKDPITGKSACIIINPNQIIIKAGAVLLGDSLAPLPVAIGPQPGIQSTSVFAAGLT